MSDTKRIKIEQVEVSKAYKLLAEARKQNSRISKYQDAIDSMNKVEDGNPVIIEVPAGMEAGVMNALKKRNKNGLVIRRAKVNQGLHRFFIFTKKDYEAYK